MPGSASDQQDSYSLQLTRREEQVLRLMWEGRDNGWIAEELKVSKNGLGVRNRRERELEAGSWTA